MRSADSMASCLGAVERGLVAVNRWILIVLLAVMSLIVFANVCSRYLSNFSIPWSEEVARHLMVWLTFLGAGPVLRAGGHIAVENLQDALPRELAIVVRVMVAALLMGFFILMTWVGWEYMTRSAYQLTAATQISFAWVYSAIPIGGLLLIAHFGFVLRGYVVKREFAADDQFDATASASL
ncbi:TRAP-type C4-dicarboxylate transport system permease small subunit [Pseudochelatococcus lubricantis]|uniref:TRAP transporter small permease protein n=1 Tax=Pseudochelatococcus lubricantis TaxID=1538102 RepID=A0ABX0V4E6_9HYPH|nr:TRAP transporter small permease [Pseudochelatococcus lubricantis]NIJ60094.1 TRAP-type C4-dicarboxylate transport system permease small subunit [Pseudochelatococcus lubricantis]